MRVFKMCKPHTLQISQRHTKTASEKSADRGAIWIQIRKSQVPEGSFGVRWEWDAGEGEWLGGAYTRLRI